MTDPAPPAEIAWLIQALGVEATLTLMEKHGGARIYIPAEPDEQSPLVQSIGLEAAQALARVRPKEAVKIPLAKVWRTRLYKARGMSYAAIARRLGIDESTVARHLKPVPSRFQFALFD